MKKVRMTKKDAIYNLNLAKYYWGESEVKDNGQYAYYNKLNNCEIKEYYNGDIVLTVRLLSTGDIEEHYYKNRKKAK